MINSPNRRNFLKTVSLVAAPAFIALPGCGGSQPEFADLPEIVVSGKRVAFSPEGDLIEIIPAESRVIQSGGGGRPGWEFGGTTEQVASGWTPWAVASTANKRFILDRTNKQLVVLDPEGVLVRIISSAAVQGAGWLLPGVPALARDGTLLVPDRVRGVVHVVDLSGNGARTLGADAELQSPMAVALDPDGNLHVLQATAEVIVVDPAGTRVASYGGRGFGRGWMAGPRSIAIDMQGRVTLADPMMAAVHHFDSGGHFIASRRVALDDGMPAVPAYASVDSDGVVHVQAYVDKSDGLLHLPYRHLI
jgi:hypothetical protein